jgi:hypothetical protein
MEAIVGIIAAIEPTDISIINVPVLIFSKAGPMHEYKPKDDLRNGGFEQYRRRQDTEVPWRYAVQSP